MSGDSEAPGVRHVRSGAVCEKGEGSRCEERACRIRLSTKDWGHPRGYLKLSVDSSRPHTPTQTIEGTVRVELEVSIEWESGEEVVAMRASVWTYAGV